MKLFALLSMLAVLMLSACAPSAEVVPTAIAQTQPAGIPYEFTGRVNALLEEGSTLSAMTAQGATFEEFRGQLAVARDAYSKALGAQTAERNFRPEAVGALDAAFTGWDLAYVVWDAKLNGGEAPHAPDAERYPELVNYVGPENLPILGSGSGSDIDPDEVIAGLLDLASDHFEAAKAVLLE